MLDWLRVECAIEKPSNKFLSVVGLDSDIWVRELKRDCRVFTLDKQEFQVYRRFERQVIPLVAPE